MDADGVSTKMGFDFPGNLPGQIELTLIELRKDFFLALLVKMESKRDNQQ
jgi:hypothetical protein